jgi:hypothetical protein
MCAKFVILCSQDIKQQRNSCSRYSGCSGIAKILSMQYCQILLNIAKYCHDLVGTILPNIAKILTRQYCQILPSYCVIAQYCQIIGIPEPPVIAMLSR